MCPLWASHKPTDPFHMHLQSALFWLEESELPTHPLHRGYYSLLITFITPSEPLPVILHPLRNGMASTAQCRWAAKINCLGSRSHIPAVHRDHFYSS